MQETSKKQEGNIPIGSKHLWPPIMVAVKKYSNNSQALHFFKLLKGNVESQIHMKN
jgi:hypothetical protein